MALASTIQGDWSGGAYTGRQAPKNAVYDAVNLLVNDEGLLYKRGGSAYHSASDASSDLYRLHALYMRAPAANRIILRRAGSSAVNVLDGSLNPISMSGDSEWSRPASVGDYAIFAVGWKQILLYGGSQLATGYNTGTVTATNGSSTVVGVGTSWVGNVDAGMLLNIAGTDFGVVQAVTDNTHINLASPWANTTAGASAYTLVRTQVLNIAAIAFSAGTRQFAVAAGSGSPRLLFCAGNRVYFTSRGNALDFDPANYHEIPASAQIIGAEGRGDNALIFTTEGVWEIDNLSLDAVDDFGNQQQIVSQVNRDVILWDDYGISGFAGKLVIPAIDDVYLFGSGTALAPVTGGRGSQYDGGIRNQYREYVAAGYQTGQASTFQGHYILPILNGTAWVDTLVCRLDHGAAWTRWAGGAGGAGYAVLVEQAARQPKLLGLSGKRVVDLTGAFDPSSSNATDADGTAPSLEITTRDYPTGGQQGGFVVKARARYELVDGEGNIPDDFNRADGPVGSAWTANPWDRPNNDGLEIVSHQAASNTSGVATTKSWFNRSRQSGAMRTQVTFKARPGVNVNSLAFVALGFVQDPGTNNASGYEARFRFETAADTVVIDRWDTTTNTRIYGVTSLAGRLVADDVLTFTLATDGTLTILVNGAVIGSVVDTAYFNAGQPAYVELGIGDNTGLQSDIRVDSSLPVVAIDYSSDQDDGIFTELTSKGEQGGAAGWSISDGSVYQWADVGKKRERIRFRLTVTSAVSSFVLRTFEMLTRPSGKQ